MFKCPSLLTDTVCCDIPKSFRASDQSVSKLKSSHYVYAYETGLLAVKVILYAFPISFSLKIMVTPCFFLQRHICVDVGNIPKIIFKKSGHPGSFEEFQLNDKPVQIQ